MAKYRFEFKKKVVQAYLEGEGGTSFFSKKYGLSEIGNDTMLRKWMCREKISKKD
ncbi:transposase [Eubacterium sp.]|uniref:transposase n=1 Tax=Eubacterium sp. TaxID=142586 RepID=UPI0026DF593C|nr:transposase [Eubacterium sp.]MDO5433593.1 transposase [Eubacterium sp.]